MYAIIQKQPLKSKSYNYKAKEESKIKIKKSLASKEEQIIDGFVYLTALVFCCCLETTCSREVIKKYLIVSLLEV